MKISNEMADVDWTAIGKAFTDVSGKVLEYKTSALAAKAQMLPIQLQIERAKSGGYDYSGINPPYLQELRERGYGGNLSPIPGNLLIYGALGIGAIILVSMLTRGRK